MLNMNLYNMIMGGTDLNSISVDILYCKHTKRHCIMLSISSTGEHHDTRGVFGECMILLEETLQVCSLNRENPYSEKNPNFTKTQMRCNLNSSIEKPICTKNLEAHLK